MNLIKKNIDFFLIAAAGALIVATMILFNVSNDFGAHRGILEQNLKAGSFPAPPIYYALLYVFSLGLASGKIIFLAIVFLMGVFIGLKYLVTKYVVGAIALPGVNDSGLKLFGNLKTETLIKILSFCLIIITPLSFGRSLYLGKIGINIWHNSTIMAEFPFALLLFYFSEKYLLERETIKFRNLLIFMCLAILIKPSYFMAFALAFPLMNLIHNYSGLKRIKIDWQVIITVLVGLLVLFLMYLKIYGVNIVTPASVSSQQTKLMVAPFYVWQIHSKNILFDLLMSIFYPIVFLIAYRKELKKYKGYFYAVLTFLIGLLIGILFVESGPRDFHGNFFWTSIIANYILFLYSVSLNFRFILLRSRFLIKDYILFSIFAAHFLSGLYYIISLYINKSF